MSSTFLWYDLETFGLHNALDRIAQFAAMRTDEDFEPVEDPLVLYCRITPDYVPDPMSCLLTGITPKTTLERGIPEHEFIGRIQQEFARPGTCVVGFNNLGFDDEFIRNTLYRNIYDPYYREWAGGNSRWDIINLMRVARDLRPEGLVWPDKKNGNPSFRLEDLSAANGIVHEEAHDALADVRATISLAALVERTQPKLFTYVYEHRKKDRIKAKIDLFEKPVLLYTSDTLTSPSGCTAPIIPLAGDPHNQNAILAFDLRGDPGQLIDLTVDAIRHRTFTSSERLSPDTPRIPLMKIQVNKAPVLSPTGVLDDDAAKRLDIDLELAEERAQLLRKHPELTQKIMDVFRRQEAPRRRDPELEIYSGFFPDSDKEKMAELRAAEPQEMLRRRFDFEDPRSPPLLWRMVCRNYPDSLDETTGREWRSFCASRLLFPPDRMINDFHFYTRKIREYSESRETSPREQLILKDLQEWADTISRDILSYES